jgi:DNA-binding NarL/FixJ family response regulator
MKVFIADDSKVVSERLNELLSDIDGVEISGQAENVPEAIQAILRVKPDVVILDLRMPGGNGITVLNSVKTLEVPPTVIILTNYPYPQYREKCMAAGADYFFDKSSEFDEVYGIVRKLAKERNF